MAGRIVAARAPTIANFARNHTLPPGSAELPNTSDTVVIGMRIRTLPAIDQRSQHHPNTEHNGKLRVAHDDVSEDRGCTQDCEQRNPTVEPAHAKHLRAAHGGSMALAFLQTSSHTLGRRDHQRRYRRMSPFRECRVPPTSVDSVLLRVLVPICLKGRHAKQVSIGSDAKVPDLIVRPVVEEAADLGGSDQTIQADGTKISSTLASGPA